MIRQYDLGPMVALSLANGVLLGMALAASRPAYYLVLAASLGTLLNLTYLMARRLWQRP